MTETMNTTQTLVEGSTDSKQISIADAPVGKKIGFFSAMMVVVGSSVGAGIFFKQGTVMANSFGSQIFSIFTWLIAAFGVIAMALALVEIASARNDNLSLIGWCKAFNSRFIYKMCKNFMFYIYLPLTYFFMPLYVIMSFQDGVQGFGGDGTFGGKADWTVAMVITVLMSLYFIVVSGISSKAGNIQNWVVTSLKFIPLVFAALIGFVIIGMQGVNGYQPPQFDGKTFDPVLGPSAGFDSANFATDPNNFAKMSPGIGLFISVGAIFFAYDGFYVTAGIQSEMKEPKKTPLAILFGLILVTVIYLLIAISMSIANPSSGSPFGLEGWLAWKTSINGVNWVYGLFQILIAVGVLGIVNGFAMWAPRFTEDLIREGELPLSAKYASKLNPNKPWVGIIYNIIISLPIIILFCIVGGLGYIDTVGYGDGYGQGMGGLYSFCDLTGTWTAVLAFAFIMFAIFGGLQNRKTNRIVTDRKSYFVPMAWSSVIIVGLSLFFTFIAPFINLFMLYQMATTIKNDLIANNAWEGEIVSRILTVVIFFVFMALMIVPTIIEDAIGKKKYGSVEAYDEAKAIEIASVIAAANPEDVNETVQVIEEPSHVENETWGAVNREPLVDQEPLAVVEPISACCCDSTCCEGETSCCDDESTGCCSDCNCEQK